MTSWLGNIQIPVADFYDLLLARYYGRVIQTSYEGITLRMYCWNGKYYVEEIR